MAGIEAREKKRSQRTDRRVALALLALLIMSSFLLGYLMGRETTVMSFRGLPDNAVIHFEVEEGGTNAENTH